MVRAAVPRLLLRLLHPRLHLYYYYYYARSSASSSYYYEAANTTRKTHDSFPIPSLSLSLSLSLRYVIERFAWMRVLGNGLQTNLEQWNHVFALFGTDYSGSIVRQADDRFWDGMWDNLRDFWVDSPAPLPEELSSQHGVTVLMAVHGVRERDGWRIKKLANWSSEALEQALFGVCFDTVEGGVGDMSVPRGACPPDYARKCMHAAKAMATVRDLCPNRRNKKRTHRKTKQFNAAGQNVAWCIIRNGVMTIVSRNEGFEYILKGRPSPTVAEWCAAAEEEHFVGGPVPREAHLGHSRS